MPKPTHQWQTRAHRAIRQADRPFADDPRSEAFVLEFTDGRVGRAACGLERQQVDSIGAEDPDLVHAVSAWLIARGARRINLHGPDDAVLARGPISPASLETPDVRAAVRLISLCPSNLEAIEALGCLDRVIACEDSSDVPTAYSSIERLGPDLGPDLDRVAELKPDLVVSSLTVPGMERNVTGLRARGVPQLVLAPRSVADMIDELRRLAAVLGVGSRGAQVIDELTEQRAALAREAAEHAPLRVYLEWWPRPMFTPGRDCYSNDVIALAGGVNVFADRPGASVQIDAAELVAAAPEVCFVSWCGVARDKLDVHNLIDRAGLEQLDAARRAHVFALDERLSGRPGPRLLEAARQMAAALRRCRPSRLS